MPKVKGPLFSVEARKQLAKGLIYQRRPGGASVYGYKKPKVPLTAKQYLQRWLIANAVACWKLLSDADKALWELKARGRGQSGYSLFMRENTAIGYNMYLAPDFSIGEGSVLPDLSRFKSHGEITGASWAAGLHGYALDFNPATPSYVEIPASYTQLNFTSEKFSIIIRVKFDALTSFDRLFQRGFSGKDGYNFNITSVGRVSFSIHQSGATQSNASLAGEITTGTFYTLGVSRSGQAVAIYKNGVDISSSPVAVTNPTPSTRSAKIGVYDNLTSYPFDGKMEFLRIFGGVALSEADHLAWHNALK